MISFCMVSKQKFLILLHFIVPLTCLLYGDNINANTIYSVFILDSYDLESYRGQRIRCGIKKVFERNNSNINCVFDSLGISKSNFYKLSKIKYHFYQEKYKQAKFSAIICSGSQALNFMLIYHKVLFKDVPIIFCGVNDKNLTKKARENGYHSPFYSRNKTFSIVKNKKNSIYTVFDFIPDSGFLGGNVNKGILHGHYAAIMALNKIFSQDSLINYNSNINMIDYNQLQRFGISLSDIFKDSEVHIKPENFMENYFIIFNIFICIIALFITGFFIIILFYNNKFKERDNLEKKKKQVEQEELLKAHDKMSSLGRVSAGVAHEIQNPLSTINVYLSTLRQLISYPDQSDNNKQDNLTHIIDEIFQASKKIENIIKRVLDFARPGRLNILPTDIAECINDSVALSAVTLRKKGIKIITKINGELPEVLVDCSSINQVLLNLITNAAEAIKKNRESRNIVIKANHNNGHINISVIDNGPGILLSQYKNIFEPFYTTKTHGSGIGLCISQRIIKDHGGILECVPDKSDGAEFRIKLPLEKTINNE